MRLTSELNTCFIDTFMSFPPKNKIRVGLHYGGERSLAQDMVIWGKGRYAGEDEKIIKYFIQVGVLRRSSFKALRSPLKIDMQRTPFLKSVCHVGIHVIFSSMYNVLHPRTIGCSVNHHWTRATQGKWEAAPYGWPAGRPLGQLGTVDRHCERDRLRSPPSPLAW